MRWLRRWALIALKLWVCRAGDVHTGSVWAHRDFFVLNNFLNFPITARRLVAVLFYCSFLAGFCAAARKEEFPGESAKWRRYQTPHFELLSANRDPESRELLHDLELLRALFFETFKLKERQPQDLTIYYFNEESDFKAYCHEQQRQTVAGYYLYRPDRAVIVLSPAWSDESQRYLIFHEYIHHLNRVVGSEPPLWYNEGVAELFSTIEADGDSVVLGKPLPWHVDSLRTKALLPLETLFAVDLSSPIYNTGKHSGQFYAESWALLHYWRYGKSKLDKSKFEVFLRYLMNEPPGADPAVRRQVFKETTGIDYPEMESRLESYMTSGSFDYHKAPLPQIPDIKSYTSVVMPREEIRERLVELSLRATLSPGARLAMLQTAEKSPANSRAWEVLGSDAWVQGDGDQAQNRWQRAMDAGSRNPAIFHELGQMEGRRWFSNFDYYFRLPEARAQQLRTLLKRSIECAPDQYAAYEMLAWVEASVVKPEIANINLVQQRFKTLRHKTRTVLALALVRVRMDDSAGAIKVLDQLDRMNPEYWVASAAETVRAKLEDRESRKISPPSTDPEPVQRLRMELPELPR